MEQLRKRYTFEEKQLIKEFLEAKESFNQKSETLLQELEEKSLPSKLDISLFGNVVWKEQTLVPSPTSLSPSLRDSHSPCLFTFPFMLIIIVHAERPLLRFTNLKYLDHEQLFLWLCDHLGFMAVDYQHDIGKLKGIIIILITYP